MNLLSIFKSSKAGKTSKLVKDTEQISSINDLLSKYSYLEGSMNEDGSIFEDLLRLKNKLEKENSDLEKSIIELNSTKEIKFGLNGKLFYQVKDVIDKLYFAPNCLENKNYELVKSISNKFGLAFKEDLTAYKIELLNDINSINLSYNYHSELEDLIDDNLTKFNKSFKQINLTIKETTYLIEMLINSNTIFIPLINNLRAKIANSLLE